MFLIGQLALRMQLYSLLNVLYSFKIIGAPKKRNNYGAFQIVNFPILR